MTEHNAGPCPWYYGHDADAGPASRALIERDELVEAAMDAFHGGPGWRDIDADGCLRDGMRAALDAADQVRRKVRDTGKGWTIRVLPDRGEVEFCGPDPDLDVLTVPLSVVEKAIGVKQP